MDRLARRAEWIWRVRRLPRSEFANTRPPFAAERNRFVYFRKTCEVSGKVGRGAVHVSADGRYRLFVNGQAVGSGPARCHPDWQCADPYDLAPFLRPGRNVVAALVHSYGRATSWYELPQGESARVFGCGGFFLQGEVLSESGALERLDTDGSWRFLEARAWRRGGRGGSLGFNEDYDARREPAGWTEASFDDSAWKPAQILRVPGFHFGSDVVPFPVLFVRDIPPLVEEVLPPRAVASTHEFREGSGGVPASQAGERENPSSTAPPLLEHPDALVSGEDDGERESRVQTAPGRGVSLILDFGSVVFGSPRLELTGPSGAVVDLTCGDDLSAGGQVRPTSGIPGFDLPPIHRYVLREGAQAWELFEPAGFRYLQATFHGASGPIRLRSVRAVGRRYPVERAGQFRCSDELLTRLWEAGARTLALCMHDAYVDCPTREQRQWVGDAALEALVNYAVFGDAALAARYLRQVAHSQRADGLTAMCAPGDFAAAGFQHVPDFCLAWILAIRRHLEYTGDADLAESLWPSVRRAVGWFERHRDADALLSEVPHWVFLDWVEMDKRGEVTALNAQYVAALRAAADLARVAGTPREAERLEGLARETADAINAELWDEDRGVYLDARRGQERSRRVSQLANSATIAFGVAPPDRWRRVFEWILDPGRLVETRRRASEPETPFDEERDVVSVQPFSAHVLHRALSIAKRHKDLLASIRSRWGPMLEWGPTFWETWKPDGFASRCHGYSTTPAFDLSTEVLGVTPTAPGFRHFRVAPAPADLEWAEGVFPTPRGGIAVAWRRLDGGERFQMSVDVPEGTQAQLVPPEEFREGNGHLERNGRPATGDRIGVEPGRHELLAWKDRR